MAIDKSKAIQLRLDGMSLQQIADTLGCSLAWCKVNLKGIKQIDTDKPLIDAIRKAGRLPHGTTTGEIKNMCREAYPTMAGSELADKIEKVKKAAKRGCKDVIIRPYWMLPFCAKDCTNSIMEMAQSIHEEISHLAKKYRHLYNLDESYQKSIVYYLSMLSSGANSRMMPQGLTVYGEQLESIINDLENRNILLCNSITEDESINFDAVSIGISTGFEHGEEIQPITLDELMEIPY